ncbi:hydroxymethylglutaryl-CoA lyase [Robbsia sp. KACC 23696]|uniref:hydroxymethylglutaryl-CoA lyase n=1 Tax=Robbsia sp. KACC 23696 TaxID=3149231 RepID=UPI00325B6287
MRDPSLPSAVRIVEVGPRDGLQNEAAFVATDVKLALISQLVEAGLRHIEATAFVSPKWVPQMADAVEIMQRIRRQTTPARDLPVSDKGRGAATVRYAALVPNEKGMRAALDAGCDEVAVFAAASETFSQRNINCSIAESFTRFAPVIEMAKAHGVAVRGYVSCVLGCPFEGDIAPEQVAAVSAHLYEMGCYEVSLGDTIGVGTPYRTQIMLDACLQRLPTAALAGHFHDTWGMAAANIYAALRLGIATFDSSVSGLGGCPYSPGATGNVATEDVVYLCEGLGIDTGVSLARLVAAGAMISSVLQRTPASRVARAWHARQIRQIRQEAGTER